MSIDLHCQSLGIGEIRLVIVHHKSADRGTTRTDWLESRHSFAFGGWNPPGRWGFRALRALNEDRVAPGTGFGPHPHRVMEILTVVLEGALEHRDSSGARSLVRAGDIALMGAGGGIVHSEWNASDTDPLHFLQIWLQPVRAPVAPRHALGSGLFPVGPEAAPGARLVAGPDGSGAELRLALDVAVHAGRVVSGAPEPIALKPGRAAWVQAVRGGLRANGTSLSAGDGLAIEGEPGVQLSGEPEGDFLLFDLADENGREKSWVD